ncbi:hypothetical protein VTN00DRAFT_14 [Thermoascus crustaceus]|uniref:uncharacterized protein n=1 Tax=Thermoascus crustaceus TaxID=5088 RepID=UPI0037444848
MAANPKDSSPGSPPSKPGWMKSILGLSSPRPTVQKASENAVNVPDRKEPKNKEVATEPLPVQQPSIDSNSNAESAVKSDKCTPAPSVSPSNPEAAAADIGDDKTETGTERREEAEATPAKKEEEPAEKEIKPDEEHDDHEVNDNNDDNDRDDDAYDDDDDDHGEEDEEDRVSTKSKFAVLYDAYAKQLQREEKGAKAPKGSAPELVKSLVRCLQALEDRIEQLESEKRWRDERDAREKETEQLNGKEEEEEEKEQENPEEETKPDDQPFGPEIKFFSFDDEKQSEEFFELNCKSHVLRVLHSRKQKEGNVRALSGEDARPDPNLIDIIEIRIDSEPIAKFLEKKINYTLHEACLIHIARPFRLLIRNANIVRDQLWKLEEKFGNSGRLQFSSHDFTEDVPELVHDETEEEKANEDIDNGSFSANPENSTDDGQPTEPFETKDALEHFRLLVEFMDVYLGKELNKYEEYQTVKRTTIAFEDLWMIFDIGETIYCPSRRNGLEIQMDEEVHTTSGRETPQAYRVVATVGGRKLPGHKTAPIVRGFQSPVLRNDKYSPLEIDCYYLDYSGSKYDCVADRFSLKPFEGEVAITSLEVYPLRFGTHESGEDGNTLEEFLIDRGRKFIELSEVSHSLYEGLTVGENPEEINSPVIVDFALAYQHNEGLIPRFCLPTTSNIRRDPGEQCEMRKATCGSLRRRFSECCDNDGYVLYQRSQVTDIVPGLKYMLDHYERIESGANDKIERLKRKMEEHNHIMLLPGVVYGFALRNRKWVELDLTMLTPATPQLNGFDDLVLPEGYKELLQALVETHARGTSSAWGTPIGSHEVDLVRGKGRGCIILLHGAPGVGKTLTAECVAEYTRRPLFPISCGDIGYDPDQAERNLEKYFTLANKWGCVLLLDEADVFLAKRNKHDIKRNGLVSVFLRILEYYSGILFLTTNRIGAFDDAFRSRIHLSLYYPPLGKKQTMQLWKMNLRRTAALNEKRRQEGQPEIVVKEKRILEFAKQFHKPLRWNGRQIRNAFQTAIALAEFDARNNDDENKPLVLSEKHFVKFAKASKQFDHYLNVTHGGHDESTIAMRDRMRWDAKALPGIKFPDESDDRSSSSSSDTDSESSSGDSSVPEDSGLDLDDSKDEKRKRKAKKSKGKGKDKSH